MEKSPLPIPSDRPNMQFKLLSAVGIVIVVAGHCYHGGISLAYEWFPTYSFQLSLFVFISGYFYKPQYERAIFRYIWKRAKRLVIPAYLWNIAYGIFILLMQNADYTIGTPVDPYRLFVMPFVDGEALQYNLGSWFVYPLFLASVFNVLFRKLIGFIRIDKEYIVLAVYIALGMYGIHLAIIGQTDGIMKLLTRTMFFLPPLQLGRLYRARWEAKDRLCSSAYFALVFAAQLMLLTFCNDLQYFPSAMSGFNNGVIIPYLSSLTGIAFWLRVTRLLTPAVSGSRIVRLIADNTYSIMIHQLMGFMIVKWLFYALSLLTGWFPDFSEYSMRVSIWYYYLPKGLEQYAILYLAGGIFFPIALHAVCRCICRAVLSAKRRFFGKAAGEREGP